MKIVGILNNNKIKGNENITNQIETQNIYYQSISAKKINYIPDDKARKLLKETIEDEKNKTIIYIKTFSGRTIQCGNGRFTVNSNSVGEKEMTYWEDSLSNLIKHNYIEDIGTKGEVFKITKNSYELYDKEILKEKIEQSNKLILNDIHIKILEMLRENDYAIWDSQLEHFFKENIDNEIAFNELLEHEYIENGMVILPGKGCDYVLNSSKKMEVLKILKEKNI